MSPKILIESLNDEIMLLAHTENNKLVNFYIDSKSQVDYVGKIYKCRVINILHSLEAYFVDYGQERHGFLPFNSCPKVLAKNDTIIAQIIKNERGKKCACMTAFVKISGEYVTFFPYGIKSGSGEKVIKSHSDCPESNRELKSIQKKWNLLENKGVGLVYEKRPLIDRIVKKLSSDAKIITDNKECYSKVKKIAKNIEVELNRDILPIMCDIMDQLKQLSSNTVHLECGGYIVIDITEAIVSIDVNSANVNNSSDVAYTVNLEAAVVAARQIVLRDLSGVIIIDFIDMNSQEQIASIYNIFKEAVGKGCVKLAQINEFGVLMMSRKRSYYNLQEYFYTKCNVCSGYVNSKLSLVINIIHEARFAAYSRPGEEITIECSLEIAEYIFNNARNQIFLIEKYSPVKVCPIPELRHEYRVTPKCTPAKKILITSDSSIVPEQELQSVQMPTIYTDGNNIYLLKNMCDSNIEIN